MFSRRRRCLVGLLVIFTLAGAGTATAFAEGPVWLVNGVKLEAGESQKAVGKGTLTFLVAGINMEIACNKLTEETLLRGGEPGTDEDNLKYSECTVVKPANCKVEEPITLETDTTLEFLINVAGTWKVATQAEWAAAAEKGFGDKFTGKEGLRIGTVHLKGALCAVKGSYELQGTYTGVVSGGLSFISELDELKFAAKQAVATGFLEYEGEGGQKLEVAA